ncbi:MAG: TRAP-type transport system small permease protein [Pseudomonadota bacterium]|nr:TRAP-type transport system small permease protein [Pseudomonadota bacterium]
MNLLHQFRHYLIALEKFMAASSLLLLLGISLFQVIARNFFETGFAPLEIISRHLVLYVTFLGAALVTEDQGHIRIDFLAHLITAKLKNILLRPLSMVAAIICSLFAWHATRFWLDEWQYTITPDRWITLLALILPAGFALIALHFLLLALLGAKPARQDAA